MEGPYCSNCKKQTDVVLDRTSANTICSKCGLILEERLCSTFHGESIATMSERLGLVSTIKDLANEIYEKVKDQETLRRRKLEAVLAACIYTACRRENAAHNVIEICAVTNGATIADVRQACDAILELLEGEIGFVDLGSILAADYTGRFGSNLGMTDEQVNAAQEVVVKLEELVIRRSPTSMAAAAIYIVSQLSDNKNTLEDVCAATGVRKPTIKMTFKELYPHLSQLIPSWFAKEEDLKNLGLGPGPRSAR